MFLNRGEVVGASIPRGVLCVIAVSRQCSAWSWRQAYYTNEFRPGSPVQQKSCAILKFIFKARRNCIRMAEEP